MLQAVAQQFQALLGLGLDVADVGAFQMMLRTIIIYACTLAIVRLDHLMQALRQQTQQTDPARIKLAYLERDGGISIIPFELEPRVLNVSVKDGVQTIRIQLG